MRYLILTLFISGLFAIGGIGFYTGSDSYEITEYSSEFEIDGKSAQTSVSAGDFPYSIGFYGYLDIIPIIDIEVGADMSGWTSYKLNLDGQMESFDSFQRFSMFATIQKQFFKLPMFKFYYGVGASKNITISKLDKSYFVEIGVDDLSDSEAVLNAVKDNPLDEFGIFAEVGTRFKPWLIPLSLTGKLRYHFAENISPDTDNFYSIIIGAGFAI